MSSKYRRNLFSFQFIWQITGRNRQWCVCYLMLPKMVPTGALLNDWLYIYSLHWTNSRVTCYMDSPLKTIEPDIECEPLSTIIILETISLHTLSIESEPCGKDCHLLYKKKKKLYFCVWTQSVLRNRWGASAYGAKMKKKNKERRNINKRHGG